MSDANTLFYAHDPMCSWCWGFAKTWNVVRDALPEDIELRLLMGGLAPDSDQPMPVEMQQKLQSAWKRIQQVIPGTEFNFDFWTDCKPRRSTWPACRAVVAARSIDPSYTARMIQAIQHAYYLQARNPSDVELLCDLAEEIGLDRNLFATTIASAETEALLQDDFQMCRQLGLQGFPSLAFENTQGQRYSIMVDHNNPQAILDQIEMARQTSQQAS